MKNKIIFALVAGVMLSVSNPVFCPATQIVQEKWKAEVMDGDGYEIIEDYETSRSDDTSCYVTMEAICPSGFGLNSYVLLMGDDGQTYRVCMEADNEYTGNIYLHPGEYQIMEVSVFDDYKQEYLFQITNSRFTLEENEIKTLSFRLVDYDEVANRIENKTLSALDRLEGSTLTEDMHYDTGLENVTMQGNGTLNYSVEHKGIGAGTMTCSGNATGDYEIVVEIIKSGVIGEAEFQISLDGGLNYIGQDVVADTCKIGDAGVILCFSTSSDTDVFVEGDEYVVTVPESFPVITSKICSANLIVKGHPLADHEISVTMLSSGGRGSSRFKLESTKGNDWNFTDIVPADGVYELEDNLSLVFSDSLEYEKDLTYTVSVKSNDDSINYASIYVLVGLVIVFGVVLLSALGSKKEGRREYRIQKYEWRKDERDYE